MSTETTMKGRFESALERLSSFGKYQDVGFAVGILGILVVLFLPMPVWVLDIGLAASLAFAILILMVSIWIEKPLNFSAFPTIILVSTLLRIALNVVSTRLILAHGHEGTDAAGHIIEGFATIVMGGNFLIGVVIFAILLTVNFMVITKGAGRIAEVAARFSLDAMPGKQMAIDADLSAGLIDDKEARRRRQDLEDESQFYGAMDGASKFVKGEAVAGLIIVGINLIVGILIGVAQMGMSASEAGRIYTVLTVGDGVVAQIPALIVSLAAGLIVSKGGTQGSTNKAFVSQLGGYPRALWMVAGMMGLLSLAPGLPFVPFASLAALAGATAFLIQDRRTKLALAAAEGQEPDPVPQEVTVSAALREDELRIELGTNLIALQFADDLHTRRVSDETTLAARIRKLRISIAKDFGFIVPEVRIRDNPSLPADTYHILVQGVKVAQGSIRTGSVLVIDPEGRPVNLPGEDARDPISGEPGKWIAPEYADDAYMAGHLVVHPKSIVVTHLREIVLRYMGQLLTYATTQKLLDELPTEHQRLVSDLVPAKADVTVIQRVLRNLLDERVPIRQLSLVLEALADAIGWTRELQPLTEHVRHRLTLQISQAAVKFGKDKDGAIVALRVGPEFEAKFIERPIGDGSNFEFHVDPTDIAEFGAKTRSAIDVARAEGNRPVIVVASALRPLASRIIRASKLETMVIGTGEIHPSMPMRTIGTI
jgi:flagellar biosynthesis protein FlhA